MIPKRSEIQEKCHIISSCESHLDDNVAGLEDFVLEFGHHLRHEGGVCVGEERD